MIQVYTDTFDDEDPLASARGILRGCIFSFTFFWLPLAVVLGKGFHHVG